MTTLLHIGFPKTGTTLLQEGVFPKLDGFAFHGPGKTTKHHAAGEVSRLIYNGFDKIELVQALRKMDRTILSDERLVKPLTHDAQHLQKLGRTLKTLRAEGHHVHLLLGTRSQSDIIKSVYLGELRNACAYPDYASFVDGIFNNSNKSIANLRYDDFCAQLRDAEIPFTRYSYEQLFLAGDTTPLREAFGQSVDPVFQQARHAGRIGQSQPALKSKLPSRALFQHIPKQWRKTGMPAIDHTLKKLVLRFSRTTPIAEINRLDGLIDDHFADHSTLETPHR